MADINMPKLSDTMEEGTIVEWKKKSGDPVKKGEVIDLRSIRPIDWNPIVESVKRTSRAVVVEEGWSTYGTTAELAAGIQERCFDYLDAPILRLGGAQVPMPYSLPLEKASIPTAEDIKRLVRRTVGKREVDA